MGIFRRSLSTFEKVCFSVIIFFQIYIILNVLFHIGTGIPYVFDVAPQLRTFVYFTLPEAILAAIGFSWGMHCLVERRSTSLLVIAAVVMSALVLPAAVFFPAAFVSHLAPIAQAIFG